MKQNKLIPIILLTALTLTSCGSGTPFENAKAEAAYDMAAPEMEAYGEYADYDYSGVSGDMMYSSSSADAPKQSENDLSSRKIIKNASVSFETMEYDEFIAAMTRCVTSHGGYVESSETYGGGIYGSRSRSSYMTVRIPADRYDLFMNEACALGTLTYRSENAEDVTMSYLDTESRLKSLRTEYDALLEILDKAESLEDVIQLQSRISEVTYEIETYESSLRKYDDLIAYCTVRIDISEVVKVSQNVEVMTFGERIRSGLDDTFTQIGDDCTDFAVWFVTSLPLLLIWAAVIVLIVLLVRWIVRRHRAKAQKKQKEQLEQYLKMQNNENSEKEKDKDNH